MDRFNWRSGLLAGTFLLQLALLIGMIAGAERTIEKGEIWRFRTAPVDPVDLFRGRYARLAFPVESVPIVEGQLEKGDRVYAMLETDDEGFARFSGASTTPPSSPDHLELVALGVSRRRVRVQLPYDRFYMDEERAPEVDRLMGGRVNPAWVEVRVHEGRGVVVDLHIEEALELGELAASSLIVWPEDTQVSVSLLEHIRKEVADWQLADCQRARVCVLAAVDLDDTIEEEFVLTTGQRPGAGSIFYAAHMDEGGDTGRWLLQPMRHASGRLPPSPEKTIEALDAAGAHGEAPPRRWLRLGDALLHVSS